MIDSVVCDAFGLGLAIDSPYAGLSDWLRKRRGQRLSHCRPQQSARNQVSQTVAFRVTSSYLPPLLRRYMLAIRETILGVTRTTDSELFVAYSALRLSALPLDLASVLIRTTSTPDYSRMRLPSLDSPTGSHDSNCHQSLFEGRPLTRYRFPSDDSQSGLSIRT